MLPSVPRAKVVSETTGTSKLLELCITDSQVASPHVLSLHWNVHMSLPNSIGQRMKEKLHIHEIS